MAGYHNELQQDSIPLKDFPRSRPNYSSIRGLYGPNFNLAVTLQEEDSGTLTWQITANEECFVVSNWRSSGALEEVIWRGPFWAVKVVRHKEVWP